MFYLLGLAFVAWLCGRLAMTYLLPRIPGFHVKTKSEVWAMIALVVQIVGTWLLLFAMDTFVFTGLHTGMGRSPEGNRNVRVSWCIVFCVLTALMSLVAVRILPLISSKAIYFDRWFAPWMGAIVLFVFQLIGFAAFTYISGSLAVDANICSWKDLFG